MCAPAWTKPYAWRRSFQALIYKLWKLRRDNLTFRLYPSALLEENKWRAVRYGLDGKLIDFGKQEEKPARDLIREMLEWFLGDVLDELGSRKEVEYAYQILEQGTSADRQLATFKQHRQPQNRRGSADCRDRRRRLVNGDAR